MEGSHFVDLVEGPLKKRIKKMVSVIKRILRDQSVDPESFASLFKDLGLNPQELAIKAFRGQLGDDAEKGDDAATRNINIKITTIPGSKGLAEEYVFITDFDDRLLLTKDGQPSDQKICDFLVALTRARRKVFLMSCEDKEPTFLKWIARERIQKVPVVATG